MTKTVVITGASKGFGYHLSKEFANNNYNVVMNSRNPSSLNVARNKILASKKDANILCVPIDISKKNSSNYLAKKTKDHFGHIDYWINNAGTLMYKHDNFINFSQDEIYDIINTNLTGTVLGMHAAIDTMLYQYSGGVIFNITGCGSNGEIIPGYSVYATSKYPIDYISDTINKELKHSNIVIKTISPGLLYTDLYKANKNIENSIVHNLCCKPEVVAKYTFNQIEKNSVNKITYLSGLRTIGLILEKIGLFISFT